MQALGTMLPVHEHSPDHPVWPVAGRQKCQKQHEVGRSLEADPGNGFHILHQSQDVTISMVSQSPPNFHRVGARMCTDCAPVYIEIHLVLGCS